MSRRHIHMLENILLVAVGGALGAVARYLVFDWAARRFTTPFPLGTLIINVIGTFILGLLLGLVTRHTNLDGPARLLIGTGFCGAFTTFSTFANENVALAMAGRSAYALLNIVLTNALTLAAALIGVLIGGRL